MRITPAVALGLLLACAPNVTYSLTDVVLVQPDACIATGLDGQGDAVLHQAMAAWNGAVGSHLVTADELAGRTPAATLTVSCDQNLDTSRSDAAGMYDYDGHVTILAKFWPATNGPETDKLVNLLVHELGHALGAVHLLNRDGAMFWEDHPFVGISAEDVADIQCAQTGASCGTVQPDPSH